MHSTKILVVEDNKMNMKLVRSLLQLKHFQVIEAEDGEQGVLMAETHLPDLILMDIQLPGMDGLSATKVIKNNPVLNHIPVVALTSHAMRGDDVKASEAGCDGYITKPIDTRHFIENIMRHLPMNENSHDLYEDKADSSIKEEKNYDSTSRYTILVVDDELRNIKLITAMLSSEPYEILQADNGEKALEIINTHRIDLVLLDVMMPGINGFEVTRIIKNNQETKNIPIILVTALDGSENKTKALEVGADEFLTKPVNKVEIITRVKSILQLRQCQEQLNARINVGEKLTITREVISSRSQNKYDLIKDGSGHQTVLLVEDDTQYVKLYKSLVATEPYNFIVASSGEEAIRIGQQINIDLILLDLMLPGMSGYEVCEYFRNNMATRNIQIIAITSLSDLESRIKCIDKGIDDYLVKPVNRKEIKSRISVLLRKKAYLDQLQAHHKQVLNLAIIDGLTGLYNQVYFKNYLQLEVERSLERGYLVALMMLDLDDFKKCNDLLGHPAGDAVLKQFSGLIKMNIRDIDLPARYGGEEFAIVMPYASKQNALDTAEKIRISLRSLCINSDGDKGVGNITTSIGIAICPKQSSTADGLIDKADHMLYQAKNTGKNKICCWD